MFISCIGIIMFCFVKILAQPPPTPDKLTTIFRSSERPDIDLIISPPHTSPPPCRGDHCQPPPNLVAPIVGSLCGILVVALIGVLIVWFYFKRKYKKNEEVPMTNSIKYIEQPPLYTGAISTTDSTSKLYEISPSRRDSINSHYYEKINYNEKA